MGTDTRNFPGRGREQRAEAPPRTRGRSERRDVSRLVREPARDGAAEDRHDADEKNRDERDEEAVLGHGDTGIVREETAGGGSEAAHVGSRERVRRATGLGRRWPKWSRTHREA